MEAAQETGNLIASEKVEGMNLYNTAGDTLGAIHDLMICKATGVAYALMAFWRLPRHWKPISSAALVAAEV